MTIICSPLYIADSMLGFGAFASIAIRKGEVIHQFTGSPISYEEAVNLGKDESYCLQTGPCEYIMLNMPEKFINHSCDPNCGLNADRELIALRDIRKDEQLFFDYSTTMLERHWEMACDCKSRNCRHIIRDFDLLPSALQAHYIKLGVVQSFILEMMGKTSKSNNKAHAHRDWK